MGKSGVRFHFTPDFYLESYEMLLVVLQESDFAEALPNFWNRSTKKATLTGRFLKFRINYFYLVQAHNFFLGHKGEELVEIRHDNNISSSVSRSVLVRRIVGQRNIAASTGRN